MHLLQLNKQKIQSFSRNVIELLKTIRIFCFSVPKITNSLKREEKWHFFTPRFQLVHFNTQLCAAAFWKNIYPLPMLYFVLSQGTLRIFCDSDTGVESRSSSNPQKFYGTNFIILSSSLSQSNYCSYQPMRIFHWFICLHNKHNPEIQNGRHCWLPFSH